MSDSHKEDLDIQETEFGGSTVSKQRKVIHFSSGETLEEEENSEEEGDDSTEAFKEPTEKARFSWRNVTILVGRMSLHTCDFLGGKLAGLLGLNAAKYQYAIDQYHRDHKVTDSQGSGEGVFESGGERLQLSPRLDREYGATCSLGGLSHPQACSDQKHDDVCEGSHNRGYQEDEHLK
ncbi:uncharacterized protein ACJ7VT_015946 [Polymixia lowei]